MNFAPAEIPVERGVGRFFVPFEKHRPAADGTANQGLLNRFDRGFRMIQARAEKPVRNQEGLPTEFRYEPDTPP